MITVLCVIVAVVITAAFCERRAIHAKIDAELALARADVEANINHLHNVIGELSSRVASKL
jgi:hypothetical protein